jgi:hypothetical protein
MMYILRKKISENNYDFIHTDDFSDYLFEEGYRVAEILEKKSKWDMDEIEAAKRRLRIEMNII